MVVSQGYFARARVRQCGAARRRRSCWHRLHPALSLTLPRTKMHSNDRQTQNLKAYMMLKGRNLQVGILEQGA